MNETLLKPAAGSKSFPMTVLTPVSPWKRWLLRAILAVFSRSRLRSVRQLKMIHFARWVTVPRRAFARAAGVEDDGAERPGTDFLLFSTNFNGPWDQYIDAFAMVRKVRRGMNFLWGTSDGFPCAWPLRSFKRYIHYHQYPVHSYYVAYPEASVRDVERALALSAELERFAGAVDGVDPDTFQTRYREFLARIANHLQVPGEAEQPTYARAHPRVLAE